jgi:hypothetical protein
VGKRDAERETTMESLTFKVTFEISLTCIRSAVREIKAIVPSADHAVEIARFDFGATRILKVEAV